MIIWRGPYDNSDIGPRRFPSKKDAEFGRLLPTPDQKGKRGGARRGEGKIKEKPKPIKGENSAVCGIDELESQEETR